MRERRRTGRASWAGFIANPSVQGACVGIILACGVAGGLIVARMIGVTP